MSATGADQRLAHVFTLLALVLPTDPLRLAFRALHTDDKGLRGPALEYLESVLPRDIRDRLWSFLEDPRPPGTVRRSGDHALLDLLHAHESIRLHLDQRQKRGR